MRFLHPRFMSGGICQYRINSKDEIVFVNEEWQQFAISNGAENLVAEKILNHSLWKFITDSTTIFLYREILKRVRAGHEVKFNVRCDSKTHRRLLELKITLQSNDDILFESRIIEMKARLAQSIIENSISKSEEILIICSWCNRINVGNGDWQEVEKAIVSLKLFESEICPQLSHGMCEKCYQSISAKLTETS